MERPARSQNNRLERFLERATVIVLALLIGGLILITTGLMPVHAADYFDSQTASINAYGYAYQFPSSSAVTGGPEPWPNGGSLKYIDLYGGISGTTDFTVQYALRNSDTSAWLDCQYPASGTVNLHSDLGWPYSVTSYLDLAPQTLGPFEGSQCTITPDQHVYIDTKTYSGTSRANVWLAYSTSVPQYWFKAYSINPGVIGTTSSIIPFAPMGPRVGDTYNVSTTTSGTSVAFSADWFYASTTHVTEGIYYDQLSLRVSRSDAASSSIYAFSIATDTPSTSNVTVDFPANSVWTYSWGFSGLAPWGRLDGLQTSTQFLYVVSNPLPIYFGTSTDNFTGLATSTCGVTNLTGCVQNALAFLFWPNQSSFDQFKQLQGTARSHAPFGYVYMLVGDFQQIDGTASSTFSISIPAEIDSAFFSTLRTGIGSIFWIIAAAWFLKRIRDLHL